MDERENEILNRDTIQIGKEKNDDANMQKVLTRIRRLEILNATTVILMVILLVGFLSFKGQVVKEPGQKTLPNGLDKKEVTRIINSIKDAYNSGDDKGLYDSMGDYVKTLIPFTDFEKSLTVIKNLGKMESVSYTDYEFLQNKDGADWFMLHYVARYETGAGSANVSVRVSNNTWEVVGFNFNVANGQSSKQ